MHARDRERAGPVESSTMEERRVVGRVGYAITGFASVQEDEYDSDYSDW